MSKRSGVQQSIISRLEVGKITDPSYTTVKKLFDALQSSSSSGLKVLCAKHVMNKRVISINPHKKAIDAWKLMKANDFSQLPVIDEHGRIHGGVRMQSLPDIADEKDYSRQTLISDVLTDPFPIVGKETAVQPISQLLRTHPAVLVIERGKAIGIITKYDLMEAYDESLHQ
jgi:predicted transcriptional regulator